MTETLDKKTPAPTSLTTAQLALYAGWTMAVLYAAEPVAQAGGPAKLPTVHELSESERRTVELGRLEGLLHGLSGLPEISKLTGDVNKLKAAAGASAAGSAQGDSGSDSSAPAPSTFADGVRELHLAVLGVFASSGLELELAYELGRSLRDTVDPRPDTANGETPAAALVRQLDRGRIAKLQEWLATLSAEFPLQVATIVTASLGRWCDFADVTMGSSPPDAFTGQMLDYLLKQGDVWLMLLVGVQSTGGLLTPEGYVSAGEAALRRSGRIVRGVLIHYWVAGIAIASALGGILYLSITQLGGASKVWTSIAAIGSAMGISAQSIKSAIARLSTEAERPVLTAAEEDAKAWAITTLPQSTVNLGQRRKLRKSGIATPVGLGRF